MEVLEARIQSFQKARLSKSTSSKAALSWPHPDSFKATPNTLAEAGFYFKPSKENPDNVQCFMCGKELDGWEEEDNPFYLHTDKCKDCPWAVARCSLERDFDTEGNFIITDSSRLPTNKALEKARLGTFGGKQKWWPHDAEKNHGASSKKMAKAGFVYTPQSSCDDTATCFYCAIILSGWDEDDDPTEEHRKREEKAGQPCPFFSAEVQIPLKEANINSTSITTTNGKAKSRKSRATSQSRAPAPVELSETGDSEIEPTLTRTKTLKLKKSTVGSSKRASEKPPSSQATMTTSQSVRGKGKKSMKAAPPDEDEDNEGLEEVPPPKKASSSRSKKSTVNGIKHATNSKVIEESDTAMDEEEEEAKTLRRSRSTRLLKKDQQQPTAQKPPSNVDGKIVNGGKFQDFTVGIDALEDKKSSKTKETVGQRKSRSKSTVSSSNKDIDKEKEEAFSSQDASLSQSQSQTRTHTRSRSRTMTGREDLDLFVEIPVVTKPLAKSAKPMSMVPLNIQAKAGPSSRSKTTSKTELAEDEDLILTVKPAPAVKGHSRTRSKANLKGHDDDDSSINVKPSAISKGKSTAAAGSSAAKVPSSDNSEAALASTRKTKKALGKLAGTALSSSSAKKLRSPSPIESVDSRSARSTIEDEDEEFSLQSETAKKTKGKKKTVPAKTPRSKAKITKGTKGGKKGKSAKEKDASNGSGVTDDEAGSTSASGVEYDSSSQRAEDSENENDRGSEVDYGSIAPAVNVKNVFVEEETMALTPKPLNGKITKKSTEKDLDRRKGESSVPSRSEDVDMDSGQHDIHLEQGGPGSEDSDADMVDIDLNEDVKSMTSLRMSIDVEQTPVPRKRKGSSNPEVISLDSVPSTPVPAGPENGLRKDKESMKTPPARAPLDKPEEGEGAATPTPTEPSSQTQAVPSLQRPTMFIPALSSTPFNPTLVLTEEERKMTVEEWIRHEMNVQFERLKIDGRTRIEAFRQRAKEVRERIETL